MTTRLKDLFVREISLVKRGANPRADVLIHKSHEEETVAQKTEAVSPADALIAGFRKALEAVEIDDPQVRTASIEKAMDEVKAALTVESEPAADPVNKGDKGGEPADDGDLTDGDLLDIEKALTERVTKAVAVQIEKAEARATAAEAVAKKLLDERTAEQLNARAAEISKGLPVDQAKVLEVLKGLPDEKVTALSEVLKSVGSAVAPLFKEIGHQSPVVKSAGDQLETIAKGLMAKDTKLSFSEAYSRAATENPTLYEQTLGK